MNKDEIKGVVQKDVGVVKEAVGKIIGSGHLQAEGLADQAVGATKQALAKAKDAIDEAIDKSAT